MNLRLRATSGHGVRTHHRTIGTFEVRAATAHTFPLLEEAYEYFKSLNVEATLWDVTGIPELLESKLLELEP
ncbi:hypothetical protein [Flaviaesturariibacter amylovorans]|uniref:Uncharacterized protein n=1 Tax=Flaviaesturariibacter amylovorans TaxID=1084520 RepID=A0ABP8HBM0_9BACT